MTDIHTASNARAIGRAEYWARIIPLFILVFIGGLVIPEDFFVPFQVALAFPSIYWAYQRCLAIGCHGSWALAGVVIIGILVFGIRKGKDEYPAKQTFDCVICDSITGENE